MPDCRVAPKTQYARSGDLAIAYQVVGSEDVDLVMAPGFISHLEWSWQEPSLARFLERLASFSRLLLFDKRGTGLSDPVTGPATLEERVDDLRAVMDAAGSERAAVLGVSEGGVFVDVAGSTALAARVGDAAWASMRARFLAMARQELGRYGGTEIDVAGDGLFATFTGPARAIHCAAAIREAAATVGLTIRAGVHAGEVEREEGGGVSGLAVHIGARVMAEAEPGEVLVSGTVKDLVVGSGLDFVDRGVRELRGVPGSWPVYAVAA